MSPSTALVVGLGGGPRSALSVAAADRLELAGPSEPIAAVAVGPAAVEPALVGALAHGAVRAVRLWSDSWDDLDAVAVARGIGVWVRQVGIGRVLYPRAARDARAAALGGALEGLLQPAGIAVEVIRSAGADAPARPPTFAEADAFAAAVEHVDLGAVFRGAAPRLVYRGRARPAPAQIETDADIFGHRIAARLRAMRTLAAERR